MRSVFYVEEDFVASLLKQYFVGNGNNVFLRRSANGNIAEQVATDSTDLFLAQSEDPERLSRVLETVRQKGRRVPTINNLAAIKRALEAAGVIFIPKNGGGPGVRLREP